MSIRVFLTGRLGIAVGSELVVRERQFRDRQGRRAFAYLVCCRDRPVTRLELAEVVWPGEPPAAWESALSAVVSRIRSLVGCPRLKEPGMSLSSGFGQYQLQLPSSAWVDLEAATTAIDEAESALRNGDPRRAFGAAGVVYAIANRPFLSGDDGAWVESRRRALERQFLRALDCLSAIWLASAEPSLAIETATQALAIDPYREATYRLLMRAHQACGNRAEAMRVYRRLRNLLADDLGADPTPETEEVYLELL